MFRILQINRDGTTLVLKSASRADVVPPTDDTRLWVDLRFDDEASRDAELALLGERFGFHPLALEDCAQEDQRPKVEEYDGYLFLVTQGFSCPADRLDELGWHELHAFLARGYLVTVHSKEVPALEQVWTRLEADPTLMRKGTDFVYYLLADRMVDDHFPILDRIADELEEVEDQVVTSPQRQNLSRIFALKHHLVTMRKVVSPQRDVMSILAKRGDERISERTTLYFRDVYDHLARIVESIEGNRDLLGNALDAYLSATSQRTNEIMKTLAILSAVFMPLTFITGFFGQNFDALPIHSSAVMALMVVSLVASPALMLFWFKSRHWF